MLYESVWVFLRHAIAQDNECVRTHLAHGCECALDKSSRVVSAHISRATSLSLAASTQ